MSLKDIIKMIDENPEEYKKMYELVKREKERFEIKP